MKPNSKPFYIKRQVENSLKDLQTDWIDLYYQHHVDPKVPIEGEYQNVDVCRSKETHREPATAVVLETLRPYLESGKIKYISLSECSIEVLKRAKSVPGVGEKIVACEMEYSPFELKVETTGFVAAARELGVAIAAYSPLGRGKRSDLDRIYAADENTS